MLSVQPIKNFHANLMAESDKSITIRAVLLAAISSGKTVIKNPLMSDDARSAISCVKKMGAVVLCKKGELSIVGVNKIADGMTYYCGNSGTLARLLIGLLAGAGVSAKITGDKSLSKRPMQRVINPLCERGAHITSNGGCLPVQIKPARLKELSYEMPIDSAQLKSSLLLSGVTSGCYTCVKERNQTRNHTEHMLKYFGANVVVSENIIEYKDGSLTKREITVPVDPSSASYYLAIGLLSGEVTVRGVLYDERRLAYIKKLLQSGAKIEISEIQENDCFSTCTLTASKSKLEKIVVGAGEVAGLIDEIPCLAVLSAFNSGALISGAQELKVKESDRFNGIIDLVGKIGATAHAEDEGIIIEPAQTVKYFNYSSDDHRMTMCAHLAMVCGNGGKLNKEKSVNISFKGYFKNLEKNSFALIGKDVDRSLSPIIHKHILNGFGVENFSYQTKSLEENELGDFLKKCPYKAINVTIPYKTAVLKQTENLNSNAKKSGSLNFVFNKKGYSFDGKGLSLAVMSMGESLKGKKVLIYGVGGAGKSIAVELLKCGATVYLNNRTKQTADDFLGSLKNQRISYYNGENCDVLINATPVVSEEIFDACQIKNAQLIIDINYGKPLKLQECAKAFGKRFSDGLPMLFYQAYYADCMLARQKFDAKKAIKSFEQFKVKYENSCR